MKKLFRIISIKIEIMRLKKQFMRKCYEMNDFAKLYYASGRSSAYNEPIMKINDEKKAIQCEIDKLKAELKTYY